MIAALGVTPANAATITFQSTYDPGEVLFNKDGAACTGDTAAGTVNMLSASSCTSLAFTFAWPTFDPLTDTVTAGTLTLGFFDDPTDLGNGAEWVDISLDTLLAEADFAVTSGGAPRSPSFNVAGHLQDGVLSLILTLGSRNRGINDFYFDAASISATASRGTSPAGEPLPAGDLVPVPEPGSLTLFGIGVVAAASRLRRRK